MDINKDLIVEHEGQALLDGGLIGQPVIQQAYLSDCLLLYMYNNLKMDYSKDWAVPNDGIILRRAPVHLEVYICEDLTVEHEDKVLFDSGLVGQPVIQRAYLNNCWLLYNNLRMDYSKGWVVPNDGRK